MVKFLERFVGPGKPPTPAPATEPVPVPAAVKEFGDMVNAAMPTIENVTGLTRRELTLQLLKTGLKGGGLDMFLAGLLGKSPAQEIKFVRVVRTLAVWVPVGLGLTGLVLICLVIFAKIVLLLWGLL